ncbi:MAG: response regulator, partial [Planctomycetales bacterium]|nr:response regulator [Planctomycetales bacterium]
TQAKILVIDDSATIRRLADNYLTPEGYQVVLAPTAEDGLALAEEVRPDMILLDHQLPGTTGYDVCCQLQERPSLCSIPVVISSTLRKKAYVEYADLPNVVDMLPKPYTSDLLTTTVRNALDTGAMVVASQTDGSAVPEVMEAPDDAALAGDFSIFTLREMLDFLNNTAKHGVLEVEGRTTRMSFYLNEGRIQGATASGIDPEQLERTLPADLKPLAPVLRMTVAGAAGAQLQGLVELLDKRVVDGGLLKRMLRHQASQLLMRSFEEKLQTFRFHVKRGFPDVVTKLPLEVSTLALLVDGALAMDESRLPNWTESHCFTRRMSRSHSLDRSGMATRHVKLASLATQPQTLTQLAEKNDLTPDEAKRVLFGLSLGELVEAQAAESAEHVVAVGLDATAARALQRELGLTSRDQGRPEDWSFHETKDSLGFKVLLRRVRPTVVVIALEDPAVVRSVASLCRQGSSAIAESRLVGVGRNTTAKLPLDQMFPLPTAEADWSEVARACWQDVAPAAAQPNQAPQAPVADARLPERLTAANSSPATPLSGPSAAVSLADVLASAEVDDTDESSPPADHQVADVPTATSDGAEATDVPAAENSHDDEEIRGLDSVALLASLQARGLLPNHKQ